MYFSRFLISESAQSYTYMKRPGDERARTWERVSRAEEGGAKVLREAEQVRKNVAIPVQQAWSGGYKRACEVGGAVFVPMALTPFGGWHREDKDSAESWTRRTTHTGDHVWQAY